MNAIATTPVRHRTVAKLTALIIAALPLPAVPASAADANQGIYCDLPQLPLQIDAPLVLRDTSTAESRWSAGATSEWNAGMNRAVDRLVNPPSNINVYAIQTAERLNGRFGATHGADRTLAGFAIVFH